MESGAARRASGSGAVSCAAIAGGNRENPTASKHRHGHDNDDGEEVGQYGGQQGTRRGYSWVRFYGGVPVDQRGLQGLGALQ